MINNKWEGGGGDKKSPQIGEGWDLRTEGSSEGGQDGDDEEGEDEGDG